MFCGLGDQLLGMDFFVSIDEFSSTEPRSLLTFAARLGMALSSTKLAESSLGLRAGRFSPISEMLSAVAIEPSIGEGPGDPSPCGGARYRGRALRRACGPAPTLRDR